MKHLIVYAHNRDNSFNHAVMETARKTLEAKGHEVVVRDLYKIEFNPVLTPADMKGMGTGNPPEDIKTEQDYLKWADVISFIHPIWWTGHPAILKGYIDRVLLYGFAYKMGPSGPEGLLSDKKAVIINTHGTPNDVYENIGMHKSIEQVSDIGVYGFCGIEIINHTFFGAVPYVKEEERVEYLKTVENIYSEL